MTEYIATLRAVFEANDDAEAVLIAETIRERGAENLDETDGDSLDVTQVTDNPLEITPQEVIVVLRRARNQLIRTRVKWAVELAQEVDKAAWVLQHRAEGNPEYSPAYPYHHFTELLESIIRRKENPLN